MLLMVAPSGGEMRNRRTCAGGAGAGDRTIQMTVPTSAASSAAIAAERQSNRAERRTGVVAVASECRSESASSANARSRADWNRRSGGFSTHRWMIRRSAGATASDNSGGSDSSTALTVAIRESRRNAGVPAIISWRIAPNAKISDAMVDGFTADLLGRHIAQRAHCHTGVGQGRDRRLPLPDSTGSAVVNLAMPKSRIFGRPSRCRNRFSGLRSRCTMPRAWAAASASAMATPISTAFRGRDRSATQTLAQVLAIEQLRHDVRLAVGRPDVVDADDIGMRQLARGPGFNLEPAQTLRIGGKARRQRLDRHIAPESGVARAIHLAHAAGTDEADVLRRDRAGFRRESPLSLFSSGRRSRSTTPPAPAAAASAGSR